MPKGKGKPKIGLAAVLIAGVAAYAFLNKDKPGGNDYGGFGGWGGGELPGGDDGLGDIPAISPAVPTGIDRPAQAYPIDLPGNPAAAAATFDPLLANNGNGGLYPVLPAVGGGYVPVMGVGGVGAVATDVRTAAARFKIGGLAFNAQTGKPVFAGNVEHLYGLPSASDIAYAGLPTPTAGNQLSVTGGQSDLSAARRNQVENALSRTGLADSELSSRALTFRRARRSLSNPRPVVNPHEATRIHEEAVRVVSHNPSGGLVQPDDDIGAGYDTFRASPAAVVKNYDDYPDAFRRGNNRRNGRVPLPGGRL